MSFDLSLRNATLESLVATLRAQHERKLDVVAPASQLRSVGGDLRIAHTGGHEITADGVTSQPGMFHMTTTFDDGVAEKLKIPRSYLRRMREHGQPELVDHNVNAWLSQDPSTRFLVRAYAPTQPGGLGAARALLSATYKPMDNIHVLTAALKGVRDSGMRVKIPHADLSERHMYVPFIAPDVTADAPVLLRGYRSPFDGASGAACPIVEAGFVLSNSEVGLGAFTLTFRMMLRVCSNGLVVPKTARRSVHLGKMLDDGVVDWSDQTLRAALDLVSAKTADTARAFLDRRFLTRVLDDIQADCGLPITHPVETIKHVAKQLAYSEAEQATILEHFVRGGDMSVGGVLHAVTSTAQTLPDVDRAHGLERTGLDAMREAMIFAR